MTKLHATIHNNFQPLDQDELETWWRTIPGARRFLNAAVEAFNKKCAIAVHLPEDDAEGFIQALEAKIQRKDINSLVERFAYDAGGDIEDFVDALTSEFAPNFQRNFTRLPMEDLAKQKPFSGYAAIIIKLESEIEWLIDAVTEFNRGTANFGVALIFVTTEENPPPNITRLEDYLTPYDVQFFAINFLENARLSAEEKMYTSTLAEKLSGYSPELVKNLARAELYNYGLEFVRKIIPDFDERIYSRAVWECQVQFLLPTLEQIRERLIVKNEPHLKRILPVEDEFGTILDAPFDMELRHLHYYGGKHKIFQLDDWELLEFAYAARNDLSHLKTLDLAQLSRLFTLTY